MNKESRERRIRGRSDKNGWYNRLDRTQRNYERWVKTFQNLKVHDEYGNTYWATHRPQLIHKGRKP